MTNASYDKFNFPSGVQLPFILRKRVEEQRAKLAQEPDETKKKDATTFLTNVVAADDDEAAEASLSKDQQNRSFTSENLENKIWKTSVALVEIQKQIHRGEETYYEETFGHGNVFKGWEGFLDAKDVGALSSSKPPKDSRWFSGSSSISRTARPPAINTHWSSVAHQPRALNTKTPTSVSSAAVMATTPAPPGSTPSTASVPQATVSATVPRAAAVTTQAAPTIVPKTSENKAEPPQASPPASATSSTSTTDEATALSNPAVASSTGTSSPPIVPAQQHSADSGDAFKIPKKKRKTN